LALDVERPFLKERLALAYVLTKQQLSTPDLSFRSAMPDAESGKSGRDNLSVIPRTREASCCLSAWRQRGTGFPRARE
jgi:hypothetical protein